jgi:hypothetical protein
MTKDERIAALIAASGGKYTDADKTWLTGVPDAHLATLETVKPEEPKKPAVEPNSGGTEKIPTKPAEPEPKTAAAAEPKLETQDEFLARNPDLKRTVDRQKAQDTARRSYLVGKLKTAQSEFTEAELNTMELDNLERQARMLKIGGPEPVADYSGFAVPRDAAQAEGGAPPKPPNYNEAVRAASSKK